MLQIRAKLPEKFGELALTDEGHDTMLIFRELMERYGIEDFQVVRLDEPV